MTNFYRRFRFAFFAFFILISFAAQAQHIGGSTLEDTLKNMQQSIATASNNNIILDTNAVIEKRLVQLALTQPSYDEAQDQITIADRQLKKAKSSWLNLLSLSTNYNDQTFAPKSTATTGAQYVYPKYFFGINIPLGLIFLSGTEIKIAKANVKINEDRQEELARTIKADVLAKYYQYKAYTQLLELQTQAIDDEQAVFLQTEQKFKDGSVTIDLYNAASKNYNNELVKKIDLQLQQSITKLDIEKMIGIRLEDALNLKYAIH
jgi:outer membrane protein TolC